MNAVFVVGGLDVHVQPSGESRFFLRGVERSSGRSVPLGVARWEPGSIGFDLRLNGGEVHFADKALREALVVRLDAVRAWHRRGTRPDQRLGILFEPNTVAR